MPYKGNTSSRSNAVGTRENGRRGRAGVNHSGRLPHSFRNEDLGYMGEKSEVCNSSDDLMRVEQGHHGGERCCT